MTNPIDVACHFCGAETGQPCRSVGHLPIVDPHMQRLKLAAVPGDSTAEREAYARSVVQWFFGYLTPQLLERARKERSINDRKPWVRRALEARRQVDL